MKRMPTVLGIYIASLAVMVIVMTWVTLRTLDLEHEERLTALSAENERLALWRMESMLLPLILEESSRDYSVMVPIGSKLPPGGRGSTSNVSAKDVAIETSAYVSCYFQCNSSGRFDFLRGVSRSTDGLPVVSPVNNERTADLRQSLVADVRHHHLFDVLREIQPLPGEPVGIQVAQQLPVQTIESNNNPPMQQAPAQTIQAPQQNSQASRIIAQQQARSFTEFQNRADNTANNTLSFRNQFQRQSLDGQGNSSIFLSQSEINAGPMTIFWIDDHLFLARLTRSSGDELAQGCLLDWDELKTSMKERIGDLLPQAELVPIPIDESGDHLSLATIPVRLIPGRAVLPDQPPWSPMQVSLTVAWGWLLLSALAIGALLFGVVRLSERRAAFVSAVTHELRTPLTTFQLYSDLLANRDALTDEKHTRYVDTLRAEAERLGHLVENVLSWSRLDQSADTESMEDVVWSELLSRIEPSLDDRAGQAGMTLDAGPLSERSDICFRGHQTAVERILFNLIDNACKYAKHADDKRIHVGIESVDSEVRICVRDHGPGIPAEIRSTLFEPFTKSATDAARSAAGVGLGLSLCRRLARNMQGDLTLKDSSSAGVTFQLRLPTAD